MVSFWATSMCQSGPERSIIFAGMFSRQKLIGSPSTSVSIPWRRAWAAVARP
jgi:hypothetical protein